MTDAEFFIDILNRGDRVLITVAVSAEDRVAVAEIPATSDVIAALSNAVRRREARNEARI